MDSVFFKGILSNDMVELKPWRESGIPEILLSDIQAIIETINTKPTLSKSYTIEQLQGDYKELVTELAWSFYGFRNDRTCELKKKDLIKYRHESQKLYDSKLSAVKYALESLAAVRPSLNGVIEKFKFDLDSSSYSPQYSKVEDGRPRKESINILILTLKVIWEKYSEQAAEGLRWVGFVENCINAAGYKVNYKMTTGPAKAIEDLIKVALKTKTTKKLYLSPEYGGRTAWVIAPLKSDISNIKKLRYGKGNN